MPFVNIGGASMHYRHRRAAREAPTLVFINSLGTDFRIWDDMADRLAGDATLLNYDKRGHGLSGGGVASMDDHVDDLAGLLDHLGIDDAILCGCRSAAYCARVFNAPSEGASRAHPLRHGRKDRHGEILERADRDRRARRHRGDRRFCHGEMVHAGIPPGPAGRPCRIPYHAGPAAARRLCRQCAALRGADYTEAARRISVPTLCVVGDQDGSTPPDLVRQTAALIPRPLRDRRRRRSHTLRRAAGRTCLACPRLYRLLACERIMNEPTGGDSRSVAGELIGGIEAVGN